MSDGNNHVPQLAAHELAAAIIAQAMRDAYGPGVSPKVKQDAIRFLSDEGRYAPTASAAGLNPNPPMARR